MPAGILDGSLLRSSVLAGATSRYSSNNAETWLHPRCTQGDALPDSTMPHKVPAQTLVEADPHATMSKVTRQPLLNEHTRSYARGTVQGAFLHAGSHPKHCTQSSQYRSPSSSHGPATQPETAQVHTHTTGALPQSLVIIAVGWQRSAAGPRRNGHKLQIQHIL